jgi:thymidylate synthase (FAD)
MTTTNEISMNPNFELQVNLIWATPDADNLIAKMARVSNPDNQDNPSIAGLLRYMMREGHVSPFEMVNACVEINTTRDIGRQILRHRSFSFQEFSQRYASTDALPEAPLRECRLQDTINRQNSLETDDVSAVKQWEIAQKAVLSLSVQMYHAALSNGIAKEQARALLPEGLTSSRMYMNGTLRSWIFYLHQRLDLSTQKEHRLIAEQILVQLRGIAPITMSAFFPE